MERILKRYKDPNDHEWFEITLDECLDKTEGCEYWVKDSVLLMLRDGLVIFTPWAEYKMEIIE